MKKLLGGLLVAAMIFIGCSGTADTSVTYHKAPVDTSAEYYETVYWGETKERERNNVNYIGREWKTRRVYPGMDYPFVAEEVRFKDNFEISLVWTSCDWETKEMGHALGMCIDDLKVEGRHNYCGSLTFASEENMLKWITEYKDDGENVQDLVERVYGSPVPHYLAELKSQIEETKTKTIGEE